MAGGFGFARYPQQPAPDSRAVGAALQQQGTQAPPDPMAGGAAPMMAPPVADTNAALRAEGAQRMTAPGQMDSGGDGGDQHSHNAISIAVGEALTRLGSGYATNPNPMKPSANNMRQLQQMGLSEVEAQLLHRTGSI